MAESNTRRISRLLPGLSTEYTIVSMPAWAWPWLDTLVEECFPQGYRAFISECAEYANGDRSLEDILESFARLRREDHYRLTNDNWPENDSAPARPAAARRHPPYRLSKAMKLFAFLPFATTWDQVLLRKGWSLRDGGSY